MIHEALHHLSTGLSANDYLDLPGWEEGVAEQMQRLLRPHVLNALLVVVPDAVFAAAETPHDYNRFIQALVGRQLPAPEFRRFQKQFASAFTVLRGD